MSTALTLLLLEISLIANIILLRLISKGSAKNQLKNFFILDLINISICLLGQILQLLFAKKWNIDPIYFDYFVYIGTVFLPVSFFFTSLAFKNGSVRRSKAYLLLLIIPIISLLVLWTNDIHHLFYLKYSVNTNECIFGAYSPFYSIYSYGLLFISIFILLKSSFENSGTFSKQSLLLIIGASAPIIINVLGYLRIVPLTIYYTPISFTVTVIFCAISIFKFNFLGVAPIALHIVVNRMSDSYIVLDINNIIIDFNDTFINTFNLNSKKIKNKNFKNIIEILGPKNVEYAFSLIKECHSKDTTVSVEKEFYNIKRFFQIEITPIKSKGNTLGTLFLLKDITQHKQDMQTIKDNQDMLMEKERLASLGQLIGGIAHNLKTPIMSIAGAAEGLNDLIKEYDNSIGDPEVNQQDHHDIAKDMNNWVTKIKEYTEYMSDVITAVKGQAVVMSEQDSYDFTVDELVKRVDILMRHELKNALITLNKTINTDGNTQIKGNVNSLVQVINNMISNSIQAYNGKTNENIELTITKESSNIIISIKDYAGGLPKEVSNKLFKEMITTKGKNGTGLGLFMSYSNIRAHFNGNITVDSTPGIGTEFKIFLPI